MDNLTDLRVWGKRMTSYIFSHISLDGGAVSVNTETSHWTHLGDNKFLIVYCQKNPNHVLARVVTFNGPTELPTLGPVCLIREDLTSLPSLVRVFGKTTHALVYFGNGLSNLETQFLEIAVDDVVVPSQTITTMLSDISAVSDVERCALVRLSDTVHRLVYFTQSNMLSVNTLVLDFDTEAVTPTAVSESSSIQSLNYYHAPIPSTQTFFEHFAGLSSASIINDDATLVRTVDVSSWQSTNVSFVSASKGFYVKSTLNDTRVFVIDDFVWPLESVACGFSGIEHANTLISLDSNHVMTIDETPTHMTALVSRVYTSHIGDNSPASKNSGGIVLNLGGSSNLSFWNSWHYAPHKIDDMTYLYWFITGTGTSAKMAYKALYQISS